MPSLRSLIKRHLPGTVRTARSSLSAIKCELSRIRARRLVRSGQPLKIEVGAGNKAGSDGWTTIDVTPDCDLFWDLRRGLPFPAGSVHRIYSSHFFEHLSYQQTQAFLDECLRVLVPGGSFSICVPNARLFLEAYVNRQTLDPSIWFRYKPAYNGTTAIDAVNYVAYMVSEHQYMFDEENLLHILRAKGFVQVRERSFDPELDLLARDYESIYAEATKASA